MFSAKRIREARDVIFHMQANGGYGEVAQDNLSRVKNYLTIEIKSQLSREAAQIASEAAAPVNEEAKPEIDDWLHINEKKERAVAARNLAAGVIGIDAYVSIVAQSIRNEKRQQEESKKALHLLIIAL